MVGKVFIYLDVAAISWAEQKINQRKNAGKTSATWLDTYLWIFKRKCWLRKQINSKKAWVKTRLQRYRIGQEPPLVQEDRLVKACRQETSCTLFTDINLIGLQKLQTVHLLRHLNLKYGRIQASPKAQRYPRSLSWLLTQYYES